MPRKTHYASDFKPDFGIPWVPVLPRSMTDAWPLDKLQRYQEARAYAEKQAELNPVGGGWILPSWKDVMDTWDKYQIHVVCGGNRCLRGDTLIYDPVLGITRRIDEIKGAHHVLALYGSELVVAKAEEPFTKAPGLMRRVVLSTGASFVAALEHRVLGYVKNPFGVLISGWKAVSELTVGEEVYSPKDEEDNTARVVTAIDDAGVEVKWDMTVPFHENYLAAGVVHHNSSKSTLASRLAVWAACTIPEAEVRCYHVSEERSIEQQQFIWDAIPLSIKNLPTKKGTNHSLTYSQKNGFTDNVCIFPPLPGYRRGGYIRFGNYGQYQQNAQMAEGFKCHFAWLDEEAPQKFFDTMLYRLIDYKGRMMLTFTTLSGWTPLVQDIMGRTTTIKKRRATLVNRDLPILQESLTRSSTAIHYFWTEDNAFIDTTDFKKMMAGRTNKDEVLARAYGVPTKSIAGVFPSFREDLNVIKRDALPWVKNPLYKVTRYMAIDPGGSKNWAMCWVAVDAAGTWWVYREWPDESYGEWALPGSTAEGKPGPAQKGSGKGIRDYVDLIRNLEDEEEVYERFIDPRMGAAERQTLEGATTIISELDEADVVVRPAPGVEIEHGIQLINNLLSWDETKPLGATNSPKFYVTDDCKNMIFSLKEYTAKGGSNEACKDFIDLLRYLATSNIDFVDTNFVDKANRTGCY